MTELTKTIERRSKASRFEKSSRRRIVVTLEESQQIGVRLEGTRQTYRLDIESLYEIAVRHHVAAIEKRANQIRRTGVSSRSATARARKELSSELK
jgi:phosphoglucomutase